LKHLRQFAVEILRRRCPHPTGSEPYIGKNWHTRLLQQNPQIKRVIARGLDRTRASAVLKVDTFKEYFELYKSLTNEYKITPQDTYNTDKKGFCMGAIQRSHVLVPANKKKAFLRQDESREWVSVIETISTTGKTLLSYIIFKEVHYSTSWYEQLGTDCSKIATSLKEWTDNHLSLNWL
jgi:hypothetical protein